VLVAGLSGGILTQSIEDVVTTYDMRQTPALKENDTLNDIYTFERMRLMVAGGALVLSSVAGLASFAAIKRHYDARYKQ